MKLLLTSQGLSNKKIIASFKKLVNDQKRKSVAIITTAARDKEKNKWVIHAKQQFIDMGFKK